MSNESQPTSLDRQYRSDVFAIDARSLAVLRIGIAMIVLWNLFNCFGSISAFFSEAGVLPLELSREVIGASGEGFWSLLWLSDSMNWLWVCFGISVLSAICLLLGYQTWMATAVCLMMVWSFQVRNPLVLTGGDVLLRMVLFWGLFLPWGSVWSFDCYSGGNTRPAKWRVASVATAAVMLQLAYIYFFSGIAKWNGEWSETAIVQSLNLEMYVNGIGNWVSEQTRLLRLTAPAVLFIEILGPILLFVPFIYQYWRGMMMALMWAMHLTIWVSMSIGIFSMTAMVTWFVFVPSGLWNSLLGRPQGFRDDLPQSNHYFRWGMQTVCAGFLLFALWMNVVGVEQTPRRLNSSSLQKLANLTMTQQEFKMFANPPSSSPWPQYTSVLANGEVVDLFDSSTSQLETGKPNSVFRYMKSQYWRRYHFNLISQSAGESELPAYAKLRQKLLQYHADKWNRRQTPERQVVESSLYMNFDEFGEDGQPNGKSIRQLWAQIRP